MISVIIPTLNESSTIGAIVTLVRRDPHVDEVLVIDDGSVDATPQVARAVGARVLTSTMLGKGASLEDGTRAARNEVLLFLDGDLRLTGEDFVERMTGPIVAGVADFVKANSTRAAGRVTTLTARPLLRAFFPELAHLGQPLGGIMAARRSLLRTLTFENDYGVDIGLVVDASAAGARIVEVETGYVAHKSQPLERLGEMANQVTRALLTRAARYGRLHSAQLADMAEFERSDVAEVSMPVQRIGAVSRLALVDMDGVLLSGRFIVQPASNTARGAELAHYLDNDALDPEERTRRMAGIFVGVTRSCFEDTARDMPLMRGARETVLGLRKLGYRVGIVTDSYWPAAEVVRRRVFADFCIAHLPTFYRGRATGEITLAPAMAHERGCTQHRSCKVNVLRHFMEHTDLRLDGVLAIGDGPNDACLLRAAGQSVAFQPRNASVRAAAKSVVFGNLEAVLRIVQQHPNSTQPGAQSLSFATNQPRGEEAA